MDDHLEQLQKYIQEAENMDEQDGNKQWAAWIAATQVKGGMFLHRWSKVPQNDSGHTMSVGQQGPQSVEEVLDTEATRLGKLWATQAWTTSQPTFDNPGPPMTLEEAQ